jgi:hypothetical protein
LNRPSRPGSARSCGSSPIPTPSSRVRSPAARPRGTLRIDRSHLPGLRDRTAGLARSPARRAHPEGRGSGNSRQRPLSQDRHHRYRQGRIVGAPEPQLELRADVAAGKLGGGPLVEQLVRVDGGDELQLAARCVVAAIVGSAARGGEERAARSAVAIRATEDRMPASILTARARGGGTQTASRRSGRRRRA